MLRARYFSSYRTASAQRVTADNGALLSLPPRPPLWKLGIRSATILTELSLMKLRHLRGVPVVERASKMRETFIRLGPAFVKAGQALATRPDAGFPPEVTAELSKLQDRMPPFSSVEAKELISSELKRPVSDVFEYLSDEPIAAASLGQVYRGRLKAKQGETIGQEVAVKVQRPGLSPIVELDVHVLRSVALLIQTVFNLTSDIVGVTDQLVGRILEEIDYRNEAKFAQRFGELYRSEHVVVPRIMPDLCTQKIMTMEWVDGVPLSELTMLTEAEREKNGDISHLDPGPIIERGVVCSLEQLLERGLYHGDPHPGNLMVTKKGQLAYLDFGMMGELDRQSRLDMLQLVVNFVNRDAGALSHDFMNLGFIPPQVEVDAVRDALIKVFTQPQPTVRLDFQGVLLELSEVMIDFRFKIPPRFALVIRALGTLEGTVIKVDPSFKVVARAYPHVLGQLLRDRSPEMRQILGSLIIDGQGQIRWKRLERMVRAASAGEERVKQTQNPQGFSAEFSVDVASAIGDAMSLVCLPENGKFRRVLIDDGSQALDRIIDQLLSGDKARRGGLVDSVDGEIQEELADGLMNELNSSILEDDSPSPSPNSANPNPISAVLEGFSSLVGAAPGPWVKLAVETAYSKEGSEFCSQLTAKVAQNSGWRGGQWLIFAAGNALRAEHSSWKSSSNEGNKQK